MAEVRPDVIEDAVDARVVLVARETAPAGVGVAGLGSTVTDAGNGSHSEDMWKDPQWRHRCSPWKLGN